MVDTVGLNSESNVVITFRSDPRSYFILRSGPLDQIRSPVAIASGVEGVGIMTIAKTNRDILFFRLEKRPNSAPVDSDGDRIDDVYELKYRAILNPLDSRDALVSNPENGLSNFENYHVRTTSAQVRRFSNAGNRIAISDLHVVAIRDDGTLWSWGSNGAGLLGDGTEDYKTSPVPIGMDTDWAAVAACGSHCLALKSDGTLWGWGSNEYGELGIGTTEPSNIPLLIPGFSDWQFISVGLHQSFGIRRDGSLFSWGARGGAGNKAEKLLIPTAVGVEKNWKIVRGTAVSQLGILTGLAIKQDGSLWQIPGEGSNINPGGIRPPSRLGNESIWSDVSVGLQHFLALDTTKRLFSWGFSTMGQLGDGSRTTRTFANRANLGTGWRSISAAQISSVGVKEDGSVFFWGGDIDVPFAPPGPHTLSPVRVGSGTGWRQAAHSLEKKLGIVAVDQDGYVWKLPPKPALSPNQFLEPVIVGTDDDWVAASAGRWHSLGVKRDGSLWAWGENRSGTLGFSSTEVSFNTPQKLEGDRWEKVWAGNAVSLGLTKDNVAYGWGELMEILGPSVSRPQPSPALLNPKAWPAGLNANPSQAQGLGHFLALAVDPRDADGPLHLYTWGVNNFGQLGYGDFDRPPIFPAVDLGVGWIGVLAAQNYSLARKNSGEGYGWGDLLPLLDGPTDSHSIQPVAVSRRLFSPSPLPEVERFDLRTDGSLWAKGENIDGQVGDGSNVERESWVPVVANPPSRKFRILPSLPFENAPDVLARNGNFDEGRLDPKTGFAERDCDDADIRAQRDSYHNSSIKNGRIVTQDLHDGFFGVRPAALPSGWESSAIITIQKINKTDATTGKTERGQIRLHATENLGSETEKNWVIPLTRPNPQRPQESIPNNLAPMLYGPTSTIPNGPNVQYWIEGVEEGSITLEFRYERGAELLRHTQTFKVATEQSKSAWEQEARNEILLESQGQVDIESYNTVGGPLFDPTATKHFIRNKAKILAVYRHYEKVFMTAPEKFHWAGLAKLAGAPVYAGLSDAQWGRLGVHFLPFQISAFEGLMTSLQTILINGNISVYRDLAWQFAAYRASGIEALQYVSDQNPRLLDLHAWNEIDEGSIQHDNSRIIGGNVALLKREQELTLSPTYEQIAALTQGDSFTKLFSWLALNPVPDGPSFLTVVPEGNLVNFSDRWKWITDPDFGMVQLWTEESSSARRDWVSIPLRERAATLSTLLDYLLW